MTRVAIVTGSSGGIGSATVARLIERGHVVVGFDLEPALASQRHLDRYEHIRGDVRDRDTLRGAVTFALDRWGRVDVAVAAAAIVAGGHPLWETPDADLQELWDVDAHGVWNTAAVTVPAMLDGPEPAGCRFVAVASAAASHGLYRLAAYSAAKHAVVGMTKGLAADLVGTGVTAVAVSPGSTDTAMLQATAHLYGMPDTAEFASNQLLRRLLEPDEIAATIAFCCSADGGVLNGSVIHPDGGFRP